MMNVKLLVKLVVGALFLLGVVLYVKGHLYRAVPITGQVLDAETGQPIAGAIVTAMWISQSPSYHAPNRELFEWEEVMTDEHGYYVLEGWKWKFLPGLFDSIAADQPELEVYKFEYLPQRTKNDNPSWAEHDFKIEWTGDTHIQLERLTGTEIERIEKFNRTAYSPPSIYSSCSWKKRLPRLLEVDKQMEYKEKYFEKLYKDDPSVSLDIQGMYKPWYIRDVEPGVVPKCPEIIEILTKARESRNKE